MDVVCPVVVVTLCHALQRFSLFYPPSSLSVLPLDVVVVQPSATMSGKAPPRGPRALLCSLQQHQQGQPSSSSSPSVIPPSLPQTPHSSPTTLSTSPANRIGAAPPTGPRSLTNGRQPPPPGPKQLLNGRSSPTIGSSGIPTGPHALQSNRHPISIKGKITDKPTGVRQNTSVRTFQDLCQRYSNLYPCRVSFVGLACDASKWYT